MTQQTITRRLSSRISSVPERNLATVLLINIPRGHPTRRDVLRLLGYGGAAIAIPSLTAANELDFPKGAIIRTVLKDLRPDALTLS
jgi:hypothetical protein